MTAIKPKDATIIQHHKHSSPAGLWAAELLDLIGHAAQDYAHTLAHRRHDDAGDLPEKVAPPRPKEDAS